MQVVPSDEDPEAVRGLILERRHGRRLFRGAGLLAVSPLGAAPVLFLRRFVFEVAARDQFPTDLSNVPFGLCPGQSVFDRLEVRQFFGALLDLLGQLLLRRVGLAVVFIVFLRVLGGAQRRVRRDPQDAVFVVVVFEVVVEDALLELVEVRVDELHVHSQLFPVHRLREFGALHFHFPGDPFRRGVQEAAQVGGLVGDPLHRVPLRVVLVEEFRGGLVVVGRHTGAVLFEVPEGELEGPVVVVPDHTERVGGKGDFLFELQKRIFQVDKVVFGHLGEMLVIAQRPEGNFSGQRRGHALDGGQDRGGQRLRGE